LVSPSNILDAGRRGWLGVIDGEDVFEGDPGGLPFLLIVIT